MRTAWTTLGYERDWGAFVAWVADRVPGHDPLGARPSVLAGYLRHLGGSHSYATARRAAYAVAARLREQGASRDDWTAGALPPQVRAVLAELRDRAEVPA